MIYITLLKYCIDYYKYDIKLVIIEIIFEVLLIPNKWIFQI